MQKQYRLRAEFASNPSAAEAEEEGVDGHKGFQEKLIHKLLSLIFLTCNVWSGYQAELVFAFHHFIKSCW